MEEPTLSQAVLSEVLTAAGVSRSDLDTILPQLAQDIGTAQDDRWTAHDCAMAVLRTLAPALPYETFLTFWAYAPLNVVVVTEEGGDAWSMMADALPDTPYARFAGVTLSEAIGEHLRALGNGHSALADYPEIVSADASSKGEDNLTAVISAHFLPPAFKRASVVKFVFGDAWAFHQGKRGIIGNFPVAALDEIGSELRRMHSHAAVGYAYVETGRTEPVQRVHLPNGATLH